MRSETDKLAMVGITARFGTEDYDLPVLRTIKMREWRAKLVKSLGPTFASFGIKVAEAGSAGVEGGIVAELLNFPERVADLLFEYSPDLPKDKILEESTEEQLVAAFMEIMPIAFPFLGASAMVKAIVQKELSPYQRPGSSTLQ